MSNAHPNEKCNDIQLVEFHGSLNADEVKLLHVQLDARGIRSEYLPGLQMTAAYPLAFHSNSEAMVLIEREHATIAQEIADQIKQQRPAPEPTPTSNKILAWLIYAAIIVTGLTFLGIIIYLFVLAAIH